MQVFVLVLVLGVVAGDALREQTNVQWTAGWRTIAGIAIARLAVIILYALLAWRTYHQLGQPHAHRAVRRMDRVGGVYRMAILLLFLVEIGVGVLTRVRNVLGGDWVLIDELLVMTPPLLMVVWGWWWYYPIDRRLREAAILRQLDEGAIIPMIWTRGQYLLAQLRHQLLLIFAPLLLLMAWSETAPLLVPLLPDLFAPIPMEVWQLAGAGVIFLLAPLMIRAMWDTKPLPAGEVRDALVTMCRRTGVRVRELLLWRTFGGMINAAVMGLIGPLRYILLTDALLSSLPRKQVEAVMAHELAHVVKHHTFWLITAAFAMLAGFQLLWAQAIAWALGVMPVDGGTGLRSEAARWLSDPAVAEVGSLAAGFACWLLAFGWVSRRFERQADAFAVQYLSRLEHEQREDEEADDQTPIVTAPAVHAMTHALQLVAELNHINITRKSWRHGSIAWRQDHLQQYVGKPVDALHIDRTVRRIKLAAALLAAALIALAVVAAMQPV